MPNPCAWISMEAPTPVLSRSTLYPPNQNPLEEEATNPVKVTTTPDLNRLREDFAAMAKVTIRPVSRVLVSSPSQNVHGKTYGLHTWMSDLDKPFALTNKFG